MIYHFHQKEWKVERLVANLHDTTEYVVQIGNLKGALNNELVLQKANKMIEFNQNASLKSYIDKNRCLRKKARNDKKKIFFKWWIIHFLEKLWKMCQNIEILNLSQI